MGRPALTHCPRGHEKAGNNLYLGSHGRRICRKCAAEAQRRHRERNGRIARTVEQRFWAKVDKTDGCWIWMAVRNPRGYGTFTFDKQKHGAHRYAYELLVGPIPDGLELDHLCHNPSCVNPDHLEAVTHAENVRRRDLVW